MTTRLLDRLPLPPTWASECGLFKHHPAAPMRQMSLEDAT